MLKRVKEFAKEVNCSTQNVYKHLKNYAAELEGHVSKDRRGTLLDDYAQDFLRSVMYPKEVSADAEMAQEINRLRAALLAQAQENAQLTGQVAELESKYEITQSKLAAAEQSLLVSKELEEARAAELEAAEARAEAAEAAEAALAAKNEALMNRGLWARVMNREV